MTTLAVVTAGLTQPSSTRLLADRLSAAVTSASAVHTIELRDLAHDITNAVLTGFPPPALRDALGTVAAADGLIAVTPTFNASYSGLFKSFFDVVDRDTLAGKPVLLAATGGTARHSLALEHAMRPLFIYLRAVPVPTAVFAAPEDWGGDSSDSPLHTRIARAAAELTREITLRDPVTVPDPFALTTTFDDLLRS